MRIPLTKYGLPQVVIFPAVIIAIMVVCTFLPLHICVISNIELILAIVLVWGLAFFRDPKRAIPDDTRLLLAPADGTVTDIEAIENEFIGGKAMRIGIFLSVFNVHINRAPCRGRVEKITYKEGKFKDARSAECSKVNESNDLALIRADSPQDRLVIRQISGAIARRIVCAVKAGDQLQAGEKFGMIKFGSRTELFLPANEEVECLVKKGDKVKAGITPLVRYNS